MDLQQVARFYQRHALIYDWTRRLWLLDHRRAVEELELKPTDRVLDLACGTGLTIPHLLRRVPASNIIGEDFSSAMLEQARRKFPSIRFVHGDVATAPLPSVDKALCTYSLSLIEEWRQTIANVSRALAPDGLFVILDFGPCRGFLRPLRWWFRRYGVDPDRPYADGLRRHFREVQVTTRLAGYRLLAVARRPFS